MRKKNIFIIFLLTCFLLLGAGIAAAASPTQWEPLAGADNAKVTVVATTPDNADIAVVGYNNGDVWLTFNAGDEIPTWMNLDDRTGTPYDSLPGSTVSALAISPDDNQTIFVAFAGCHYPGKLWKTSNGGEWFTEVKGAPFCNISSISINPVDSSVIYLIANGELWVSEDYGNTWAQDAIVEPISPPISDGSRISAIASAQNVHCSASECFLVGTTSGEVWMTLNGSNWTRIDEQHYGTLPNRLITRLIFDDRMSPPMFLVSFDADPLPNDRDSLWHNNGGEGWVNIYNADLPNNSGIGTVSINPVHLNTMYVTSIQTEAYINTYKTEDSGMTWTSGCTCDIGCHNPELVPRHDFGTHDGVCFAIEGDINGWTTWNTQGRDIEVNGQLIEGTGGNVANLPQKINDRYYFYFSSGDYPWAGWVFW